MATEVERLAHVTFGDCPTEIRDKLAASQFISCLASEEMKRTLRLGGFTSLGATVLRAQEIETVESDLRHSLKNEARSRPPLPFNRNPSRGKVTRSHDERREEHRSLLIMLEMWKDRSSGEGLFCQEEEER